MDRRWLAALFLIVGCSDLPDPGRWTPDGGAPNETSTAPLPDCSIVLLERDPVYWQGGEVVTTRVGALTLVGDALRFGGFPVFAAGAEPLLAGLVGAPVVLRGKVVDVGRGRELWVGALVRRCDDA